MLSGKFIELSEICSEVGISPKLLQSKKNVWNENIKSLNLSSEQLISVKLARKMTMNRISALRSKKRDIKRNKDCRQENELLRQENELLRKENELLRKEIEFLINPVSLESIPEESIPEEPVIMGIFF